MLKQAAIMVALSIVVVFLAHFLGSALHGLGAAQLFLVAKFDGFLPQFVIKPWVVKIIVLLLIPFLLSLIVAFFYWLVKRKELPHLAELTWILWIVSSLLFVLHI